MELYQDNKINAFSLDTCVSHAKRGTKNIKNTKKCSRFYVHVFTRAGVVEQKCYVNQKCHLVEKKERIDFNTKIVVDVSRSFRQHTAGR